MVGDQYLGKTAQGQYVLVYVTVTNIGDQARTFDSGAQKLKDAQGGYLAALQGEEDEPPGVVV